MTDRLDKISIVNKLWNQIIDFLFNEACRFMAWAVHLLCLLCTVFVFLLGIYWALSGFLVPGVIILLLLFYYLDSRDRL